MADAEVVDRSGLELMQVFGAMDHPAPDRAASRARYDIRSRGVDPRITVVIPVFNAVSTLEAALLSALHQKYANVEVVVVDGRSDDGTDDLIARYGDKLWSWTSEPDRGVYDAMNKGVAQARGDWILFLGADDILVDCLHRIAPRLRDRSTIYYGDVYRKRKNRVYDGPFPWHKLIEKNVCQQCVLYPRSVFSNYAFRLDYPVLADWDLNLRLWADPRYRVRYLPVLIAIYDDSGLSGSQLDTAFLEDKPRLVEQLYGSRLRRRRFMLNAARAASRAAKGLGIR